MKSAQRIAWAIAMWIPATLAFGGREAVGGLTSWTMRFNAVASHASMTTGCYGTASYGYMLPDVPTVQAYRRTLKAKADARGLSGFVFTSQKDSRGQIVTVRLSDGVLGKVPPTMNSQYKGVPFCVCRSEYVQSRWRGDESGAGWGMPNCAATSALRPLGDTFYATAEPGEEDGGENDGDDGETPSPPRAADWVDPATGWGWIFASPAADWKEAKTLCQRVGYELPNHPVIGHAARRIWASPLGTRLYQADSRRAWTSEEFDWYGAMAVFFPGGDAGSVNKRQLFPVLCVKR